MARKYLHKVIFQATNNHDKQKGTPPYIDTTDLNKYSAYFQNENHDQFIFVYDYQTHAGTLWLSTKGWENPFPVIDGKAQNSGLGYGEKTWLKACWHVATAVDRRREHIQNFIAARQQPEKPIETVSPSRDEANAQMGHLYDALAQTTFAPNCSKYEFVSGWTDFIALTTRLEAKYKDQLEAQRANSAQTKLP